jgi:MYXO-CTERM domain-containing protein
MLSSTARLAIAGSVLVSVAVAPAARAQSRPFPTAAKYAQGFIPKAATTAVAQKSYTSWKAAYLKTDCGSGNYRVDNGNASTFSEGQGYGMVLTAYYGDKAAFDGLWAFAQKNYNGKKLMGWHVTCSGFTTDDGGDGSAADGDTDIAFGLVVAAAQWGGTYVDQAKKYLATLKSIVFTTCSPSGRVVVTAGSWQGNEACTTSGGGSNTSYWMPAYYRVFQTLTGDTFWGKAANDVVTLYGLAANANTGLMANEVDQNGAPVPGQTYDYNSCRIPWRAALDYLWYGTAGAKQTATKLSTWVSSVGITKIVDGYKPDGTPTGQYTGLNAFAGGFAVGGMADTQAIADSFGSYFVGIADDNGGYYGATLRALYLLTMSGNQWNPAEALGGGGPTDPGGGGSGTMTSGGSAGTQPSSGGRSGSSTGGGSNGGRTGAGGSSTKGGAQSSTGAAGSTSRDASTGGPANAATKSSSGCGCRVGGEGPRTDSVAALAALTGVALFGRRTKRRTPRA